MEQAQKISPGDRTLKGYFLENAAAKGLPITARLRVLERQFGWR
jgi:hypothetical protein